MTTTISTTDTEKAAGDVITVLGALETLDVGLRCWEWSTDDDGLCWFDVLAPEADDAERLAALWMLAEVTNGRISINTGRGKLRPKGEDRHRGWRYEFSFSDSAQVATALRDHAIAVLVKKKATD